MDDVSGHSTEELNACLRERAIGLFNFLHDFCRLRTSVVYSLDSYEKVLWLDDIPREPGCTCAAWTRSAETKESETWLSLDRPHVPPPPKLPEVLEDWVTQSSLEDSSQEMPTILDHRLLESQGQGEEAATEVTHLSEHPEVSAAWDDYILQQWWPWAEADRRLRKVQHVYTELFSMYQKQQRLGEQFELILGQGLLMMSPDQVREVKRHLLTSKALIEFNRTTGAITVVAASEGAGTSLETDMVDPQYLPDAQQQLAIERQVSEIAESVWDPLQVDTALKGWINLVSAEGTYDPSLRPQEVVTAKATVHLAPAIILRARTDRFLLKFFEGVLTDLKKGSELPAGIRKFVAEADRVSQGVGIALDVSENSGTTESEVYFPLPANAEQRQIVDRLAVQQGVVVQGPPGTGKSHTIVNLICDLLAKGQRVLVTSHTARALQVLRRFISSKLEEVSPLCVLLLGNDREALQSMEDSVQGITVRYNNRDAQQSHRHVAELEKELAAAREREARIAVELRQIRESDTYRHSRVFSLYEGTLQQIAQHATRDAHLYDWLPDQPLEAADAPLSNDQALELLALLRQYDLKERASSEFLGIDLSLLSKPSDVEQLFQNEMDAIKALEGRGSDRDHTNYSALRELDSNTRSRLTALLAELLRDYDSVSHHAHAWAKKAATEILGDRDRAWRELLRLTREHLRAIGDRADRVDRAEVSGLGGHYLNVVRSHATDLVLHLKQGGRLGFGVFRSPPVKQGRYLIEEVHFNGRLCNSRMALEGLLEWIEVGQHFATLERLWAPHAQCSSPTLPGRKAEYEDMCEPLEMALDLHRRLVELKEFHRSLSGLTEPIWHEVDNLQGYVHAAQAVDFELRLDSIREQITKLTEPVVAVVRQGNCLPPVRRLLEAICRRDIESYLSEFSRLLAISAARAEWEKRQRLVEQLRSSAPMLSETLTKNPGDSSWSARLATLEEAWNWQRILIWVRRMSDYEHLKQVKFSLDECQSDIHRLLKELAAARAWEWCFARMTAEQAEHLVAWSLAVRRIGRGTGSQAPRHRRAAQEHLEKCRGAIPAWIMPVYRVAETMRPEPDIFDVAVIDEASQSGPEALLLLYLAKKIVVVGDDKQISPEFVGIQRDDVNVLRERHLANIPHADSYGAEESFFALAEIRYQGRIRLREHFRCMPEIIQFSNNLSYQHEPLIPLRQYGSGRLKPVVQSIHVSSGYRKGQTQSIINPPEAQAVVDKVLEIVGDLAYEEKTIGIISLQGDRQAQYIETLLMDQLGPERMASREIVCGDAYAFQGDERDIILLSLVAAPDPVHRIGTLSGLKAEQRFNVAASRARDQMLLFHTATLNDLSPQCVRHRLLEYCQNPKVEVLKVGDLNPEDFHELAMRPERDLTRPPSPFDSWFEVDVYLRIADRGYRVIPQFEVAGYLIDLVIDGMKGRLGVECDGDQWHGPDRYEADMTRQRVLERCGWTIERIRGGAFYLDPDESMEGLWRKLIKLQIYPDSVKPSDNNEDVVIKDPSPALDVNATRRQEGTAAAEPKPETSHRVVDLGQWRLFDERTSARSQRRDAGRGVEATQAALQQEEPEGVEITSLSSHPAQASYQNWSPVPVADPRKCGTGELVPLLVSIVEVEGPILADRTYHLLAQAAGIHRLREGTRATLDKALRFALRRGLLLHRKEHNSDRPADWIIRTPNSPFICLRTPGGRSFDEIPPSELALLMKSLLQENKTFGQEELFRRVLSCYGVRRMTHGIRQSLDKILRDLEKLTNVEPEPTLNPSI